jgi:16S rRNA (cytidine1402-2'-O)-methyltransferase
MPALPRPRLGAAAAPSLGTDLKTDFSLALQAAQAAAGAQDFPAGTLYMVATPIGNLADISLRALHLLGLADQIACEDTRHTAGLLKLYGISKPLKALHEHNEREAAAQLIAALHAGQRIAYVSDAGTPAVSDPGARLGQAVRAAGLRVMPLPGASSITALISAAGMGGGDARFVFEGFLSTKARERSMQVQALAREPRAVILLEAPHRIEALAADLATLGERMLTVGRELTKQFEQIVTLSASELPAWLAQDKHRQSGEFVMALHPQEQASAQAGEGERVLRLLLPELPTNAAVRLAAQISGEPKNTLYELALQLKQQA